MFLQLFLNMFCNRRPYSGILVLILGIVAGPALGQDQWGLASQPEIAALSAVLMNPVTGEVLFAKEPHLRLPPASTTKVLTALVALEHLDPNARVLVSPQAASAPPSRIGLRAGEAALTQDLLYGLMLKSGNDAAETLAEAAGGSIYGFAEMMNAKASQIGAHDSHFMNPHGLPNDDHYSTAYDLALIFRQAMNNPMFADIVRTRNAALRIESSQGPYGDWRMVPVVNHNRLLGSYEGTLGGKTGFTLKARRCFVGEVDRNGVRLIVAVLNSPTSGALWRDARALLDYGFAHYGVGSPPPSAPLEPLPVLVQREPVVSPDEEESDEPTVRPASATRVAMIRPAPRVEVKPPAPDWQEKPEPVVVEPVTSAQPVITARTQRAEVESQVPDWQVKSELMAVEPVTPAKPVVIARTQKVEVEPAVPNWQEDFEPVADESAMPAKRAAASLTRRIANTHAAAKPAAAAKPMAMARPVTMARPVATPVVAKPMVAGRPVATPVVAKPMVAGRPVATPVVAKPMVAGRPVATPVVAKPMVAGRPVATPVVAKPMVAGRPVATPVVAKPMVAGRPVATPVVAKPMVAAKPTTKPLLLAMNTVKPTGVPNKAAKTIMASPGKAPVKPVPIAPAKLDKRETAKVAVRAEPVAKPQNAKR